MASFFFYILTLVKIGSNIYGVFEITKKEGRNDIMTIYQKQIRMLNLNGLNEFMRVYYPEYYKKNKKERKEFAKAFHNQNCSTIYNEILTNAMDRVNANEELLQKRILEIKLNGEKQEEIPVQEEKIFVTRQEEYDDFRRKKAKERDIKMKEWFDVKQPELIEKISKDTGIEKEDIHSGVLENVLSKYGFAYHQANKIMSKYYISEENMEKLDKLMETETFTYDKKYKTHNKIKSNNVLTPNQKFCTNHRDDIYKYIVNNYKNVQDFIDKEDMPFTASVFYQYRSTYGKITNSNAKILKEWYEKETNNSKVQMVEEIEEVKEPRTSHLEAIREGLEENTSKCITYTIKASNKSILGNKLVKEEYVEILEKVINSLLSPKDKEDILFIKQMMALKEEEESINTSVLSLLKATKEYQEKETRLNSICEEIKELAKVME